MFSEGLGDFPSLPFEKEPLAVMDRVRKSSLRFRPLEQKVLF